MTLTELRKGDKALSNVGTLKLTRVPSQPPMPSGSLIQVGQVYVLVGSPSWAAKWMQRS